LVGCLQSKEELLAESIALQSTSNLLQNFDLGDDQDEGGGGYVKGENAIVTRRKIKLGKMHSLLNKLCSIPGVSSALFSFHDKRSQREENLSSRCSSEEEISPKQQNKHPVGSMSWVASFLIGVFRRTFQKFKIGKMSEVAPFSNLIAEIFIPPQAHQQTASSPHSTGMRLKNIRRTGQIEEIRRLIELHVIKRKALTKTIEKEVKRLRKIGLESKKTFSLIVVPEIVAHAQAKKERVARIKGRRKLRKIFKEARRIKDELVLLEIPICRYCQCKRAPVWCFFFILYSLYFYFIFFLRLLFILNKSRHESEGCIHSQQNPMRTDKTHTKIV